MPTLNFEIKNIYFDTDVFIIYFTDIEIHKLFLKNDLKF